MKRSSEGKAADNRLHELDVLRGIAAVAVVLFHFTARYGELFGFPEPPSFRASHGFLGVQFFFCISGFVIFMTLERTRRPLDFVVSRFSRLWPAYIIAIALTYTIVEIAGLPGRQVTPAQALMNLTMIQELLRVPHVDGVYWSLQVELIFYSWMFLAYASGLLPRMKLLLAGALLVPVASWTAKAVLHRDIPTLTGVLLLQEYIPYFAIGITAYGIRTGRDVRDNLLLMLAAVAVAGLFLSRTDGLVAAGAAAVFWFAARGSLAWLAAGPLVFLGTVSYTLYLLHQNIGYVVIRAALAHGLPPDGAIAIAACTVVALAAALTYLVERPARDWIRQLYARWKSRSRPTQPAVPPSERSWRK